MTEGVVKQIAEKWIKSWEMKRAFTKEEKDLLIEFAEFVDRLMEGEDEET